MKELLLKIRHWLIRELGGYTEQQVIVHRHEVINAKVRHLPIPLRAEVQVDNFYLTTRRQAVDYSMRELREILADELLRDRLIRFSSRLDYKLNTTVFRAELFVMDPHDATICGL